MSSRHDPADSLADILENVARVERYLDGTDRDAFERDGLKRDAVERCIERICEAGHRLGTVAAEIMPDQPWADIRGMGNQLRHAYHRVDVEIVWNTATRRLPELAADARRALAKLESERS